MSRATKMLTSEEVMEDLGVAKAHLITLRELKILHPIYIGRGWKFSQKDILDFQRDYAGLDVSNRKKAEVAKQIVDARKERESREVN